MGPATRTLATSLRPLFWDYDPRALRWDQDHDLIVGRVLREGGWSQVRLLRSKVGDSEIRAWILRNEAGGMSPAQIRFWELILKLPRQRAEAWVQAARGGNWEMRRRR